MSSALDGQGAAAQFDSPTGIAVDPVSGNYFVLDSKVRKVTPTGLVSTFAGNGFTGGVNATLDGIGTAAGFNFKKSSVIVIDSVGTLMLDNLFTLRTVNASAAVKTIAGSAQNYADGIGTGAFFHWPKQIARLSSGNIVIADYRNHRIRLMTLPGLVVTTLAGDGFNGGVDSGLGLSPCCWNYGRWKDGIGTGASFNYPHGIGVDTYDSIFVAEEASNRVRLVTLAGVVRTLAGSGGAAWRDGWGVTAEFNGLQHLAVDRGGRIALADATNRRIRQLTCLPCPPSFYCFSGAPIMCPPGSFCPPSSLNATLCPAGTFSSASGATACQQCPGGHYCPIGTSSWARLNCGRGNYCPDGSGAPTPCPAQVPPSGGWGALQAQGPAYLVETAHCLNHCFWNLTSGDGVLSKC